MRHGDADRRSGGLGDFPYPIPRDSDTIPPMSAPLPESVRRPLWWRIARFVIALAIVAFIIEALRVTAWSNQHTVIPGKIYRSAQPNEGEIREYAADKGVKTIINLRGLCPEFGWYQNEARASADLGISQEDITLSANSLPSPNELRRVVEVLDRSEYPILIHCRRGADRTALVSAMALLLFTDATLGEARQQLLVRYGHFRFGRTAAMDKFFELYEESLAGTNHTRERFRHWVLHDYTPGPARSHLTWVEPFPSSVPTDTPLSVTLRAENRSNVAWELKPGTFASIHVAFTVYAEDGSVTQSGRTGLRFETVPPGGSTNILVPLSGLKAGRYKLIVELHDSTAGGIPFLTNSFVKFGDESLIGQLVVK